MKKFKGGNVAGSTIEQAHRTRTVIYVEGYHGPQMREYVQELRDQGFVALQAAPGDPAIQELLRLTVCDVLLVIHGCDNFEAGAKIGFALACGLKVIGVGAFTNKTCFHEHFLHWPEFAKDHFMVLGDGYQKKALAAAPRRRDRRKL